MFSSEQDIANILSSHSAKNRKIFLANQIAFMVWLIFFTGTRKEDIPNLIFKDLVTGKWELKPVMTKGRKSFTIDPELNQHWVKYQQQYRLFIKTNIQVPMSLKQMVFPNYKKVITIGRHLEKIFDETRVFMAIRYAGIRNCCQRYRAAERYNVDCYNQVAKFYGLTYREIDSVIKGSILKPGKAKIKETTYDCMNIVENLKILSNKIPPLNAVDYHAFRKLVDELNGLSLSGMSKNYKKNIKEQRIKYTEIFADLPIP